MAWFRCHKCEELHELESLWFACDTCNYSLCDNCYFLEGAKCTQCAFGWMKKKTPSK